jgi:hypothetical protein
METLVIRLMVPEPPEMLDAICGVLEHPARRESMPFASEQELLRLLQEVIVSSPVRRPRERG